MYLAEVLNAVVLPLQIISFAGSLKQAGKTNTTSICGMDYDIDYIWQWNKFTAPEQFSGSYLNLIKNAEHLFILRSTDDDSDCPVIGKHNNLYINTTFENIDPSDPYLKKIKPYMDYDRKKFDNLGQWEWSLPDDSIRAVRQIWKDFGKEMKNFHVVEDSTVDLYKRIIPLWEEYLNINNAPIRGFSLNAYFTTHPYYEKAAGLIPVNFYKFDMVSGYTKKYLKKYLKQIERTPQTICAFTNEIGSDTEIEDLQYFLEKYRLNEIAWF